MTAQIVMDAGAGPVVGSLTLLGSEVNTPVTLSNVDNTGVAGWRWEILDAPEPSPTLNPLPPASFSDTAAITPDVKGHTIIVRLTTYRDAVRTQIDGVDQQVIRVRFDPPFDWVIPAAQQSIEANEIRGWAADVNRILRETQAFIETGGGGGMGISDTQIDEVVQTVGATTATIATYATLADNRAIQIRATVWGYTPSATQVAKFVIEAVFARNGASVVTSKDEAFAPGTYEDLPTLTNFAFLISGQDIQFRVTGHGGATIEWRCQAEVSEHG